MLSSKTHNKGCLRTAAKSGQRWQSRTSEILPQDSLGNRHYLKRSNLSSASFSPLHRCESSTVRQALLARTKAFSLMTF